MLAPTTTASPPPMGMGMNRTGSYMTPTTSAQPGLFNSSPLAPTLAPNRSAPASAVSTPSTTKPATSSGGGFDDLWKMSLGASSSIAKTSTPPPAQSKSIKDLEREKAQAGIWGQGQNKPPMGAGFGAFGASTGASSSAAPPPSSGSGIDDLLF